MSWFWSTHVDDTYPPMVATLSDDRQAVDIDDPGCTVRLTAVHSVTGAIAFDDVPCDITNAAAREVTFDFAVHGPFTARGNYLAVWVVDKAGDGQDIETFPSPGVARVIHVE